MWQAAIVLLGVCIWLLVDRQDLSHKIAELEKKVAVTQKQNAYLEARLAALRAASMEPPKNWLQERIEQSSGVLQSPRMRGF